MGAYSTYSQAANQCQQRDLNSSCTLREDAAKAPAGGAAQGPTRGEHLSPNEVERQMLPQSKVRAEEQRARSTRRAGGRPQP